MDSGAMRQTAAWEQTAAWDQPTGNGVCSAGQPDGRSYGRGVDMRPAYEVSPPSIPSQAPGPLPASAPVPCSYAAPTVAAPPVPLLPPAHSPHAVAPTLPSGFTAAPVPFADTMDRAPPGVAAATVAAPPPAAVATVKPSPCGERDDIFVVDIMKEAGKSLGLKVAIDPNGMVIHEVHDQDENGVDTHICEWNRACEITYPREAVKPFDRIIRVNGARPDPAVLGHACCDDMRRQVLLGGSMLLLLISRPGVIKFDL